MEGTSLTSFIEDLRKGFIEWASLKKIHAEINKGSPLEEFNFNYQEMIHNGCNIPDPVFYAIYGLDPMISESTRMEIILLSLSECETFRSFIQEFKIKSDENKTMDALTKDLRSLEPSQNQVTKSIKGSDI